MGTIIVFVVIFGIPQMILFFKLLGATNNIARMTGDINRMTNNIEKIARDINQLKGKLSTYDPNNTDV